MLAMLAPGLTGLSVAMLVGLFVIGGGIVRMIWAFRIVASGSPGTSPRRSNCCAIRSLAASTAALTEA